MQLGPLCRPDVCRKNHIYIYIYIHLWFSIGGNTSPGPLGDHSRSSGVQGETLGPFLHECFSDMQNLVLEKRIYPRSLPTGLSKSLKTAHSPSEHTEISFRRNGGTTGMLVIREWGPLCARNLCSRSRFAANEPA